MICLDVDDEHGDSWEVVITSDVRPFWLSVVHPKYETFYYDEQLMWDMSVLAWQEGETEGHEAVNLREFHYEPPTDEELEAIRERRNEFERKLVERFC